MNTDQINTQIEAELAIIAQAYRLVDQAIENKANLELGQIAPILSELADTVHAAKNRLDVLNTMKRFDSIRSEALADA